MKKVMKPFMSEMMPRLLLLNAVEAKIRGIRAMDRFRKKINDSRF